ncbi:MAG: hypothetical protein WCO06_03775 [Candidatus Roizmanbacteria bacterium]
MKQYINLFRKDKVVGYSDYYDNIAWVLNLIGGLLFIAFLIFSYLQYQVQTQYNEALAKKTETTLFLKNNSKNIASINIFMNGRNLLYERIKNDSEFLPYYTKLKEIVAVTEEIPNIDSIVIEKDKSTKFIIRYKTYTSALQFVHIIESETFLSNFTKLKLSSFNLSKENSNGGNEPDYVFNFEGNFKIFDKK